MNQFTGMERVDFDWVCRAVSTDVNSPRLTTPWSEAGWMCGTDGRRLHMAKTTATPGRYNQDGSFIGELNELSPPDTAKLFPEIDTWVPIRLSSMEESKRPDIKDGCYIVHGAEVYKKYITDVFSLNNSMLLGLKKTDRVMNPTFPLYFRNDRGTRKAIVLTLTPFDAEEWRDIQEDKSRRAMYTRGIDEIVCPHCGCNDFDNGCLEGQDWNVVRCTDCDKKFECYSDIEIRYTTIKVGV